MLEIQQGSSLPWKSLSLYIRLFIVHSSFMTFIKLFILTVCACVVQCVSMFVSTPFCGSLSMHVCICTCIHVHGVCVCVQ